MTCHECGMRGFHLGHCSHRPHGDDPINPKHYEHVSGVTTIEVNRRMTFDSGNAFKYVLRHKDKGTPLQDLTKARWYIADAWNHRDRIFNSHLDRIEATALLEKMWHAEPDPAVRCFFTALHDMDLVLAGEVIEAMIRELEE
jgi:hypothetical protein